MTKIDTLFDVFDDEIDVVNRLLSGP